MITVFVAFLIIELIILFFLSRMLSQKLYILFILVFHARSIAVSLLTFFLFPGTIVHELAHLFTAEILGVHTGKLTLVPENIQEEDIRAGSVTIFHTDPFRRTVIGLAPVFVGIMVLAALSSWLATLVPTLDINTLLSNSSFAITLVVAYFIFAVSNSMFSSGEDMKGVVPVLVILGLLGGAAYFAGIRFALTGKLLDILTTVIHSLVMTMALVLAVNGAIVLATQLGIVVTEKITKRRVIIK